MQWARTLPARCGSVGLTKVPICSVYANSTLQAAVEVGANPWLRYTMCDREGRMWFCTLGGVFYQDEEVSADLPRPMAYPIPRSIAVFHDREHQFWFATWNGVGLYDAHSINVFGLHANESITPREISQITQRPAR